jgi:hypothetical protein
MGKKQKAPKPDYASLWRTYDKWRQEDRMWYETQKAEQEKGADIASEKARMSAAGLQAGSRTWESRLANIKKARPDIEGQYTKKQKDLQSSLVYQDLQKKYQSEEKERISRQAQDWMQGLREGLRSQFGQTDDFIGKPWDEKQQQAFIDKYQLNRGGGEGAPQLRPGDRITRESPLWSIANPGDDAIITAPEKLAQNYGFVPVARSFDQWGAETFGRQDVANPYARPGATPEEKARARAKVYGSGRQKGATGTTLGVTAAFEESPWM